MKVHTRQFEVQNHGKGTKEISAQVESIIRNSEISNGTVTVFVKHTSASLVIMENADPSAQVDLVNYFEHLVPEDTPYFVHTHEGPDDMPSHIRMALTRTSEVIPIINGQIQLGTWQGIFLFEHRRAPHNRKVLVTVMGV